MSNGTSIAPIFLMEQALSPEKQRFLRAFLHANGVENTIIIKVSPQTTGADMLRMYSDIVSRLEAETDQEMTSMYAYAMLVPPVHRCPANVLASFARLIMDFDMVVVPTFSGYRITGFMLYDSSGYVTQKSSEWLKEQEVNNA